MLGTVNACSQRIDLVQEGQDVEVTYESQQHSGRGGKAVSWQGPCSSKKVKKVNVSREQKQEEKEYEMERQADRHQIMQVPVAFQAEGKAVSWQGPCSSKKEKESQCCLGYRKRWEKEYKMERQRLTGTRSCRALWPFKRFRSVS